MALSRVLLVAACACASVAVGQLPPEQAPAAQPANPPLAPAGGTTSVHDLPVKVGTATEHQLYGGTEYTIWLVPEAAGQKLSVHVYDSAGKLQNAEALTTGGKHGIRFKPKATGTYSFVAEAVKDRGVR